MSRDCVRMLCCDWAEKSGEGSLTSRRRCQLQQATAGHTQHCSTAPLQSCCCSVVLCYVVVLLCCVLTGAEDSGEGSLTSRRRYQLQQATAGHTSLQHCSTP